MRMQTTLSALFLSLWVSAAHAASPGSLLTYEGVLTDSGGTPISTSQTVTFKVLYGACILYSESQSITPGTAGEFSVVVGTGTRLDTTNNTADRIFASAGSVNCNGASAVSMSGFTTRTLRISVGGVDMTPDVEIGNIPVSINSQKLADKGASEFLQVNSGNGTTQTNLESVLSRYTNLNALLNAYAGGTLTAQTATNFTGSLSGDVSGTQNTTSVDKIKGVPVVTTGVADGKILKYQSGSWVISDDATGTAPSDASYTVKGIVQLMTDAATSGLQVSSGTIKVNKGTAANQIVALDASAKLPAVDGSQLTNLPVVNDSTKLPLAGGTMSGPINMGAANITNTGYITMNSGSQLHLSNNSVDPSLATVDKGKIWFNSTSNQIKYWDGTTAQALGVAGAGITSLVGDVTGGGVGAVTTTISTSSVTNAKMANMGSYTLKGNNTAASAAPADITIASLQGTTANTFAAGNDSRLTGAMQSGTAASGDLTGTYPSPVIASGAVTTAKIASGTILGTNLDFTGVNSSTSNIVIKDSSGKFYNFGCSTAGHVPTWTVSGFACQAPTPLLPTLADAKMWVGVGGTATAVSMSGDATLANSGALTLASTGVTAATYSKVTVDSKGRVTTGANLSASDVISALTFTPLNKAGDVMTGSLGLGNYTDSTESVLTSSWGTADKGKTWFNTTSNVVRYWDGSAVKVLGVAGAGLQSLNGLGVATQTFATPSTSGTALAWTSTGSTHTLNIPMASVTSVTAGLITKAEYDSFAAKQAAGNYITALTGDVTAAGPGSSAATISNGVITSAKIADGTIAGVDMDFTGVNAGTSNMVIKDASGKFYNFGCSTAGQVATWSVAGWTCAAPDPTTFASLVPISKGGTGASTATAAFNNLSPLTTKGDLHVHDGTNNIRLPAGGNGQLLMADSAQTPGMKWFTPNYFVQGGNTFGVDADLGTADAYGLNFKTNGITRMTLYPSGNLGLGVGSPAYPLAVGTSLATGTGIQLTNYTTPRSYTLNVGGTSSTYGSGAFAINDETAGKPRFVIDATGATALGGATANVSSTSTNPGPGVLTLNGGGTTLNDTGVLEFNNPISTVTAGTSGGRLSFNAAANNGQKTLATVQVMTEGSGGANGYGGRLIFSSKPDNGTGQNINFVMLSNGNVGIGVGIPTYRLDVSGDVNLATGSALRINGTSICTSAGCTSTSDRRLKEDIEPLQNSLENILKLQGVSYYYNDKQRFTDQHQVGVIAQDVENVFPEVVVTDEKTGFKAVAYDHLIAPLIEAVKTLYAKFQASEEKRSELDRKIASLSSQKADRSELAKLKSENEELKKKNELLQKDLILIKSKLGL